MILALSPRTYYIQRVHIVMQASSICVDDRQPRCKNTFAVIEKAATLFVPEVALIHVQISPEQANRSSI